jgi:predicted DNA-binding transcriptional regulator AlpA
MSESETTPKPLLLSAAEAARLCAVTRTTCWQLHFSGRVALPVRLGLRTLWRRDELAAWVGGECPARDRGTP